MWIVIEKVHSKILHEPFYTHQEVLYQIWERTFLITGRKTFIDQGKSSKIGRNGQNDHFPALISTLFYHFHAIKDLKSQRKCPIKANRYIKSLSKNKIFPKIFLVFSFFSQNFKILKKGTILNEKHFSQGLSACNIHKQTISN